MKTPNDKLWPQAFHWWIDAVGGFLAFTKPQVRIGRAGGGANDIAILGDLSGHHADVTRGEGGNLLVAHRETTVNGKPGSGFLLRDGDRVKMRSVELVYHQPVSWSSTARLKLASGHRLSLTLDGVVLLGDTCIVGPREDAHIRTDWPASLFVSWHQNQYWIRSPGPIIIDGREYPGWGPLTPTSQVEGPFGAFRFEPAGT